MQLKLQVVIFNREMSDPHLSMLPVFDFIHEYQPIWICGLWPLQVDGIFFFCFPCYRSWNVICSLCKIFTSDVRTTPITETSARTGENKRFALFFRCRSIAVSAVQRPTAKCIGLLGRLECALCQRTCSSASGSSFQTFHDTKPAQTAAPTKGLCAHRACPAGSPFLKHPVLGKRSLNGVLSAVLWTRPDNSICFIQNLTGIWRSFQLKKKGHFFPKIQLLGLEENRIV